MTVRKVLTYPDPFLRQKASEIVFNDFNEELKELSNLLLDMAETMYENQGIGLAATQIGIDKQLVVLDVSYGREDIVDKLNKSKIEERVDVFNAFTAPKSFNYLTLEIYINPKILASEGKKRSEEGCLSIPNFRDKIWRKDKVVVEATNLLGETHQLFATDLRAICLQHEIDHLNGVLFTDHLSNLAKNLFKQWAKKNLLQKN
jgi:peptide deformylase